MSHLYLFACGTLGLELKHWGSRTYIRSLRHNVRLLCCIHDGPNFHGECMYGVGGNFVPDAFVFLRSELGRELPVLASVVSSTSMFL